MTDQTQIQIASGANAIPIQTGVPKVLIRHSISDEELTMLCEKSKDFSMDVFWVALGVIVGSLPTAIVTIHGMKTVDGVVQIKPEGLTHLVLLSAGVCVAIVSGISAAVRAHRNGSLEQSIRKRTTGEP